MYRCCCWILTKGGKRKERERGREIEWQRVSATRKIQRNVNKKYILFGIERMKRIGAINR